MTYLKVERPEETPHSISDPKSGAVLFWNQAERRAILFRCPCGDRAVYVVEPPHGIQFDDQGRLTIEGSCGYKARPSKGRPANWCHFFIRGGEYEMCSDTQCPGKDLI